MFHTKNFFFIEIFYHFIWKLELFLYLQCPSKHNNMKKRFTLSLVLLFISVSLFSQNSTQGMEFWLSFMQNGYQHNGGDWVYTQVMISAKRACHGTLSNPRTSWSTPFEVDDESVEVLYVPLEQGYNVNNEGVPSDFGLKLVATDTVSVYTANCATNSFDATFVLPIESLGSDYIMQCGSQSMTLFSFSDQETSAFLIVATDDHTHIDIIPSVATIDGHAAGTSYSIELDKGQTYSMRSNYNSVNRDFSGTYISARDGKKIAVFNGNTLTTLPDMLDNGFDHIFEQALPVETWGQQFVITSSFNRTRDEVKVTAGHDNDSVWCNGQFVTALDAGQSYNFWLYSSTGGHQFEGGSCSIETSQPSMVYLYNTTGYDQAASGFENGDPSMVWIPPVEQKINEITFCTFNNSSAYIDNHYVNIVVESSSVNEVILDGNLINPNQFQPVVGNDAYSFVKVEISHGIHHLSCIWGLIAHVYGFGYAKGYAYCVGANVMSLSGTLFVNGQLSASYHNGLFLCVDESVDFLVRTNYPVQRVFWDFDGTMIEGGAASTHTFDQIGDFVTKAFIEGVDIYTNEPIYDTMTFDVHVGEPEYHNETYELCDVDSFEFYGVEYTHSGHYERIGTSIYGCDSTYILTLDLEYTPHFEFVGTHWPIGGSETHISVNEYGILFDEPRTYVDTVIWQIDCPNWHLEPHGFKGKNCTLYIHSYLQEPVILHAWAINRCDTVHEEFFIQTSYYDVEENTQNTDFMIAPNPTNGNVTLRFGDLTGMAEIEVVNSLGQKMDAFKVDVSSCPEKAYDMSGLKNGLYYFILKNNGRVLTRKVTLIR